MSLFNFLVILSSEYCELVRGKRRFGFGGVREIGRHPGLMYVAGFDVYAIGGEKWIRKREQNGDRSSKTTQSSEAPASSVIASARILNYIKLHPPLNKISTAVFLMVIQNICISRDFYPSILAGCRRKHPSIGHCFGQPEPQIFAYSIQQCPTSLLPHLYQRPCRRTVQQLFLKPALLQQEAHQVHLLGLVVRVRLQAVFRG